MTKISELTGSSSSSIPPTQLPSSILCYQGSLLAVIVDDKSNYTERNTAKKCEANHFRDEIPRLKMERNDALQKDKLLDGEELHDIFVQSNEFLVYTEYTVCNIFKPSSVIDKYYILETEFI